MSDLGDRVGRLEDALATLADLTVQVAEAQARNTADIAELSADIRRLFDGMSEHLRAIIREMTEPPTEFRCEALGCERPADWAYIGEGGDMYLCEFHGGPGDVEGWTRIVRTAADLDAAIADTVDRVNRGDPDG